MNADYWERELAKIHRQTLWMSGINVCLQAAVAIAQGWNLTQNIARERWGWVVFSGVFMASAVLFATHSWGTIRQVKRRMGARG